MLVSVALVVLMMLIFAQIFELAAGSMGTQRGIAENDQRGRTLTTIIRGDLDKRTYRLMIPFGRGEYTSSPGANLDQRKGYFSISENNPNDDTDDVLQFTVGSANTSHNKDETPYFGRAALRGVPTSPQTWAASTSYAVGNWVVPPTQNGFAYYCSAAGTSGSTQPFWQLVPGVQFLDNNAVWIAACRNQPEADDGWLGNGGATSTEAEVTYFLRNGTLYRRVLLVREPNTGDTQPLDDVAGTEFFDPAHPSPYVNEDADRDNFLDSGEDINGNGILDGNFWNQFDYSAHYDGIAGGVRFHGTESLNNASAALPARWQPSTDYEVGDRVIPRSTVGLPLTVPGFVYRCNIAGTSSGDTSEPSWANAQNLGDTVSDGAAIVWENVTAGGTYGGIVRYPLGIPGFRFGHSVSTGLPREFVAGMFIGRFTQQETSHSSFMYPHGPSTDGGGNLISGGDPMTPGGANALTVGFDGAVDQYRGGPRRAEDILMTNVHSFDVDVWDDYREVDLDGDGAVSPAVPEEDLNGNGVFDSLRQFVDIGHSSTGGSGAAIGYYHAEVVPDPFVPGFGIGNRNTAYGQRYDTWYANISQDPPFRPLRPTGYNSTTGTVQRQPVPLSAIRITIRYLDVSSDQMRQLTLVHSLIDD